MKKLLTLILISLSINASAQSNLTNCKGFWDRLVGPDTSSWSNCFGEITYDDGRYYTGEWQQGKKAGQGTFTWPNGEKYIGQFANDVRWGTGTHYYNASASYTGEWKNDAREGQGSLTDPNGDITSYIGGWMANAFYGNGVAILKDGTKLEGKFNNKAGVGNINYPNGEKYAGQWDENWKKSGQGKILYVTGATYSGDWSNDKKHGNGTYVWPNGKTYSGYWDNDKKTGQGKLSLPNGDKYTGQFSDDTFNGKGTYLWKNGDKYDGEWSNGMFNGRGTRSFANKNPVKDGYWENNNFIGTVDQVRQREQARRNAEETQKAVNCGMYKLVRFSCASAGNVDTCLSLRFGADYMSYEWMCR